VSSGDGEYKSFTRRDPATSDVRSRTRLVQYGTNAPPTVAGDRVYVTTFIEVFCLAANRDAVVWRGPEMDGIQAPPTVSDGTVFVNSGGFTSTSPQLRAFDAATGNEQWRYDTESRAYTAPAVADDCVFIASSDGLHAIDATNGERLYISEDIGGERATPVASTDSVYIISRGERGNDQLAAVNATDGSIRWRESFSGPGGGPPVVADDLVYIGTESGVRALDTATGRTARSIGGTGSPAARVGEVIYTTDEGTISALDATGGGQLWSHTTEQVQIEDTAGRVIYGVTPATGAVYVSARDGFHGFGPA
jgi:outer membrane protein assembly factor BamB